MATDQEVSHGRVITWTLRAKEAPQPIRESKPFEAAHLFLTSPKALLRLVRDRWSLEG